MKLVIEHIRDYAMMKGIRLDCINGYLDHVHCLVRLAPGQKIHKTAQLIKGESSHWINQQALFPEHFTWQKSYYAASVYEKDLPRVRNYIRGQAQHHKGNRDG